MNITCDTNHIYRVDGVIKPGVNEILGGLGMFDFRKSPDKSLEEGRERGTEVHSLCESWDKGKLKVESIDERLVGYFKSYLLFLKDYSPKWITIEKMFYSKAWGFCGKPDRTAEIDKSNILIDLKTSVMKSPAYEIASALYQVGIEETENIKIQKRWVLKLKKNGDRPEIVKHLDKTDRNVGLSAVTLYKWKTLKKQDADIQYNKELYQFNNIKGE